MTTATVALTVPNRPAGQPGVVTAASGGTPPDVTPTATPEGPWTRRPQNKSGRYVETGKFAQAVVRMVRALGRRVGHMDIDELATLAALTTEAEAVTRAAALRLHDDCGYNWADIGRALGITKQTAFRRYARPATEGDPDE